MATTTVKLTPIVLDKARNLRLDFNALAAAEDLTGKNFLDEKTWQTLTAKDVRALLFAALKHEDEKLKVEDVGAMLDPGNMEQIVNALEQAYAQAMPEPKDGPAPLRKRRARAK